MSIVPPPRHLHTLTRGIAVGRGMADLDRAAERLLTWQVHRDAGLRVDADGPRAAPGVHVTLRLGPGRLAVAAPCVVIGVVAEETERGFSYQALPGHPEEGVEHFRLSLSADGAVLGTIHASSAPSSRLARAGGPLTTLVQRWQTDRYLRAMRVRPA